jgi:hypothetical protein
MSVTDEYLLSNIYRVMYKNNCTPSQACKLVAAKYDSSPIHVYSLYKTNEDMKNV